LALEIRGHVWTPEPQFLISKPTRLFVLVVGARGVWGISV